MTTYVDNDKDVNIFLCILRLMKGTLFPHFSPHHWKMPSPPSSLQTRSDELNRHCLTKCQRRNKSSTRHHQRRKVTGKAKNEDHQAVITVLLASSLPINFLILILFLLPTHSILLFIWHSYFFFYSKLDVWAPLMFLCCQCPLSCKSLRRWCGNSIHESKMTTAMIPSCHQLGLLTCLMLYGRNGSRMTKEDPDTPNNCSSIHKSSN